MKKNLKKVVSFLFSITAGLSILTTPVLAAASSVTYEGGAERFVFLPGSDYTDTDLFDNFKGVMPGDKVEQKITVKNDYRGCDYVKIYMRAEAHDEAQNPISSSVAAAGENFASMTDFLSKLSMRVYQGEKVIYEASPDELDGLSQNVLLGRFAYGESAQLNVVLEVPIELGNEYAYREGEVDWVFVVEHYNDSSDDDDDDDDDGGGGKKDHGDPSSEDTPSSSDSEPDPNIERTRTGEKGSPKTGDETVIWPYLLVLGLGLFGAGFTLFGKKKQKQR